MYLTVHAASALGIITFSHKPLLSLILGIIMHFLLDLIPHDPLELDQWMKKNYWSRFLTIVFIDFSALFCSLFLLNLFKPLPINWNFLAALIGVALPDVIWGIGKIVELKILEKFKKFHLWVHRLLWPPSDIGWPYALLIQTATFIFFFSLFIAFIKK